MSPKHESLAKLLPEIEVPDGDRETPAPVSRSATVFNIVLIVGAAALLAAVLLLPKFRFLQKGDTASRTITAPYTINIEYQGPDMTLLSYKISRGEVIVEAGQRVTEKAYRVLEEMSRREGIGIRRNAYMGLSLVILLFFYLMYRDIKRYRPTLIADSKKMFLLVILLVVTVVISQFSKYVLSFAADQLALDAVTIGFALPVSAGAMLVCLLLDFHLALSFSFVVSVLLGILYQGDPFIPIYYFLGSITAALSVIHCKKRTAVLRASALIGLVNIISITGIDLFKGELASRGIYDLASGIFSVLMVSMVVSVLLPFFETIFDIATDIKLLELLDPNQPLLKELVYKSPGTYHHSIVIGNLAEAAAEAIGENPILARVGAYYHDVGKIRKPEYFIENQRAFENKHDRLTPSMSSLIISSHVKDGVEIARAQRLPPAVIDIIRQHHGTALISYFFQKARDLQPLIKIAEEDYRYPGPRPRTKVAAIVMLADSVEAASRTVGNPTPDRIQALTNSVITRIFLDDQLGKCDLTLKDLRDIARSFNLVLGGIFHQRIDYPGIDFFGEKKRRENQDKKQSQETKAGNGSSRKKDHQIAADP